MENMTVKVVGVTTHNPTMIADTCVKDLEYWGGISANICNTQKSLDEIQNEPREGTMKRANNNLNSFHGSVFGHDNINLYFEGIPKIIAMLINNEHEYNTSEKSGRYTTMFGTEEENKLYDKWKKIYMEQIKKYYPNEAYLTDKMIEKKALENSRYLLSIFMRTKMEYTTSFRQLNYLYAFTERMIADENENDLFKCLKPYLEEFRDCLLSTGYIEPKLIEHRNRKFSLLPDFNEYEEMFGASYSTNYKITFPAAADLFRHRSINYSLTLPDKKEFYVPHIIRNDDKLTNEWLSDISSVSEYPQGLLMLANERGTYENFIGKMQERMCTAVQLEAMEITNVTLHKYLEALKDSKKEADQYIYNELLKYSRGARCTFPNFTCPTPCHFKEGINLTRKI